ncbi:hypothetical protein EMCRGX_G015575 [Ephydatia muelleri]
MYRGDKDPDDQNLCVVEHKAIRSLCHGLVQQRCCRHVPLGGWSVSRRHVHAVTCAGMLPSQFMNFCKFAEMGEVKQQYISSVYLDSQYQQIIAEATEESMKLAVERVKACPHYATSGEAQSIPMVVESVLAVRVKWAAVVTLADSDLRSVGGGNRWGDEVLSCLQWKWVANYGWQWADNRMTVRDMLS